MNNPIYNQPYFQQCYPLCNQLPYQSCFLCNYPQYCPVDEPSDRTDFSNMKVVIRGGTTSEPTYQNIPKGADLAKVIQKELDEDRYQNALLLSTQPGTGKTHAVMHGILPWAIERDMEVLYVSSRTAINTQVKRELTDIVGLPNLKKELTPEGLRVRTEFGCMTVITYHKLYSMMLTEKTELNKYEIFIFDEVHALLEDAMFVGITGYILNHMVEIFGGRIRIYMTATPEEILPQLKRIEGIHPIRVIHMPRDYSYLNPHFFSRKEDIVRIINEDHTQKKWLVYIPYISEGEAFRREITHPTCMMNGKEREQNEEKWYQILEGQKFDEKVCIVTSIVDAGVNFHDDQLKNVVVFTTSPVTLTQVLGRKRRKKEEKVNLYVQCPTAEAIQMDLYHNREVQTALRTFRENKAKFMRNHILMPTNMDLRAAMYLDQAGEISPNSLALVHLQNEEERLQQILDYGKAHNDSVCFDRFVARWLRLSLPERSQCWLDEEFSGTGRRTFRNFLKQYCGLEMDHEAFQKFALEFQTQCVAAYGKGTGGKDRTDRIWGIQKLNNKLEELNMPYNVVLRDNVHKLYELVRSYDEIEE